MDHPHKILMATICIILGGLVDFFDGYIARRLGVATDMGKQLDSFADIITFGIVPIMLINYALPCEPCAIIAIPSFAYIMAGAYRLARYNLGDFAGGFMGLPITVAGISLAIYCAVFPLWADFAHPVICAVISAMFVTLLAIMMLSKKYIELKVLFRTKASKPR